MAIIGPMKEIPLEEMVVLKQTDVHLYVMMVVLVKAIPTI